MAQKVDAHQHFWNYNTTEYGWINDEMNILRKDYGPEELKTNLIKSGFDGSVAVQARQSLEETEWLLGLAEQNDSIKGVVGWVDLCSSELDDQLKKYSQHDSLVGVRHVIHDEPDDNFVLRDDFVGGVKKLAKYNLTYDILIFEKHLPQTLEFVNKFSNQLFVLDHIAKPLIKNGILEPWKENIQKLAEHENVYCKLSGMVTEADWQKWKPGDIRIYLDVVINAFGTERLMIGSDWPVCLVAGEYADVMNIVKDFIAGFSEDEKEKILGVNALKAYGIK